MTPSGYVGRFAPSPTGPLHRGSLLAAAASYLQARASRGRWLVRIEDIDPPREMPGAADDILRTLERFGFEWDGPVVYQSRRIAHYRERLAEVRDHTFWCRCSRQDIRRERERLGTPGYPGTCRRRGHAKGALRFRLDRRPGFVDGFLGPIAATPGPDDFVVWRRDDLPAYQWAVAIDDAEQGITEVVRGADLLDTTPRQIAVLEALGAPLPRFAHVPVVVNASGQKLSKQTGAEALPAGLERDLLCAALRTLGLPEKSLDTAASLPDLWARAIRAWPHSSMKRIRKIGDYA